MGLFAARPQEPFEWAGLPSEPLRDRSEAEYLEDPPADPFAITTDAAGSSIAISVVSAASADPAGLLAEAGMPVDDHEEAEADADAGSTDADSTDIDTDSTDSTDQAGPAGV